MTDMIRCGSCGLHHTQRPDGACPRCHADPHAMPMAPSSSSAAPSAAMQGHRVVDTGEPGGGAKLIGGIVGVGILVVVTFAILTGTGWIFVSAKLIKVVIGGSIAAAAAIGRAVRSA